MSYWMRPNSRAHTVKPAYYGLFVVPLPDDELYMRVFFCDGLKMVEKEGAHVRRARPFVAVLEKEFPTLRDEGRVTVCLGRTKTRPENWSRCCPHRHRRRGGWRGRRDRELRGDECVTK